MLKKPILFLFIFFLALRAVAQEAEKIIVKSGEDIAAVLASYGMYRFPAFKDGMVVFRNGDSASGKMNYNIYLGLVQFIDTRGDTLAISNPETIDAVSIDSSLFYYRKGYYQVMASYEGCKLVMKQKVEFRPVKLGAYGIPTTGTAAQTYESMTTPFVINSRLLFNEDIVVVKQTSYFLFYKKYREEAATVRGFLAVFPNYKTQIQTFIQENKTDFNKLEDLKKLVAFCASQRP